MAELKRNKTSNKKRRLNNRGKRLLKKTIAGLLIASSLIVAAIPEDKSGIAHAANDPLNYAADRDATSDLDFVENNVHASSFLNRPTDESKIFKSYQVIDVNRNGQWQLAWQYKYYNGNIAGNNMGIVCEYNDLVSVDVLDLTDFIITSYEVVKASDFNNYINSYINGKTFTLDVSPYDKGTDGTDWAMVQEYYSTEYETFKNNYDTALQNRRDQLDDQNWKPTDLSELSMTALVVQGNNMSDTNKKLYYCAHNFASGSTNYLAGCTLELVANSTVAGDQFYANNAFNTIPTEDSFYIVRKYNDSASFNFDKNGFMYNGNRNIGAISSQAFMNTSKVDTLVVGNNISYIGDEAFMDSFIKGVNFKSVIFIGNRVFKNCNQLKGITLSDNTKMIGKEAFYGCLTLEDIKLTMNVSEIGFGAFANCPVLRKVDFSENLGCNIGGYAFYDCLGLKEVIFPSASYKMSLGKASFALTPGTGTTASLEEFAFPAGIPASNVRTFTVYDNTGSPVTSRLGDYVLANRCNLKRVTMPVELGSSEAEYVPLNTFDGCLDLDTVFFAQGNNKDAFFDPELFEDVQNNRFYVFGPELSNVRGSDNKYYSRPRRSTWLAKTAVSEYVPYVYNDGVDHYEVGIDNYRYELSVNDAEFTAKLLRCEFIGAATDIDLVVPGQVAAYRIKDMEHGCYDAMKPNILSVQVADDSIETLGKGVFSECDNLTFVMLGNSVKSIGDEAFAKCPLLADVTIGSNIETIGNKAFYDCPNLTDVYFAQPYNYNTLSSFGNDAFLTNSPKLYFHADLSEGYLPFDYAMGDAKINTDSIRICCESLSPQKPYIDGNSGSYQFHDSPNNYKAIYDESTGLCTLIDYPHYDDLPADLRATYEAKGPLNDMENALLNNTLYLVVPEAVKSIDVKSFLDPDSNNPNKKNWIYIDGDDMNTAGNNSWISIYGTIDIDDTVPGLFSGYIEDKTEINAYGDDASLYAIKGNDWIISIDMPGVLNIPDNAFESCERLQSVIISKNCQEIGASVFKECSSLENIGTNGNNKYSYDNYILYEKLPDDSLEINSCLPSRGENNISGKFVEPANDSKLNSVSSIKEGAFEDCKYIVAADFGNTSLAKVPASAFNGCTGLSEVVLPDTIKNIDRKSFNDVADAIKVTIPTNANISEEAFDKDTVVTIYTYPECDITANYAPYGYKYITIKYLEEYYFITFYNDDFTVYEEIKVYPGNNGFYPEKDPSPLLPTQQGYTFSYWLFDNDKGIRDVHENRRAQAIFIPPVAPSNSPSGSPSGNPNDPNNPNASPSIDPNNPNGGASASPSAQPSNNNNNNNNNNNASASPSATPTGSVSNNNANGYTVTVENGAGSGTYQPGKVVTITAYSAGSANMTFDKWTTSNSDIGFSNPYAVSTTFIMPGHDVKVTATFKSTVSGNSVSGNGINNNNGNNNNNSGNNNNNNNNNNGSVSGNSAANTPNKGNTGGGANGNGTEVRVTTDSIDNNNKNLVSATVAGSTDNFVVKITDSAAATALVDDALRAKYGSQFDNIKYVAFDISLYDSTGTYLIENSDDLAVTITLPIPDQLAPYAGNNRAAAVINGAIDDKTVKFTTIDGVPCMTFTATHFSPYTIYADTQNLVLGVSDSTPKTGDGIAPKWFLSIALACMGLVMFLSADKRKLPVGALK